MSNAEPTAVHSARHARGYTLVEVMVVAGLVAMMSMALNQAVRSTQSADVQLETVSRAALRGQRLTNEIANLVTASRHIFNDDAIGQAYLAACDLSRLPPVADARMPIIDDVNDMGPDGIEASHTGNLLLMVRETTGSPCVANEDIGKLWIIDTYRLTAIYPHQTATIISQDKVPARDVVVWHSEAFPSLQQIMEIPDPDERESVVEDLVKRYGFTHAWDPGLDPGLAFYELDKNGEVDELPAMNMELQEAALLSPGLRLAFSNVRLASTDAGRFLHRAVLTADEAGGWKPNGLELKISGASMARKVWIHTVVEAFGAGGRKSATQSCTTIADARDY